MKGTLFERVATDRDHFGRAGRPSKTIAPDTSADLSRLFWRVKWLLTLLPFTYLWFRLFDNLHIEWSTNPQYAYGWLVPILCLGLIVQKWGKNKVDRITGSPEYGTNFKLQFPSSQPDGSSVDVSAFNPLPPGSSSTFHSPYSFFALLAFFYLPTRLVEAATPEWRPVQWLLGIEAIGLTLFAIELSKGRSWFRRFSFPVLFFFVAIPWPTIFEQPIIQTLTRISSSVVVEVLGWSGVPAMAHGNVIEVATGTVGIDEACSGIRSFQSSIMISLFFGEFYALIFSGRFILFVLAFVFSMAFNISRMAILTFIAARQGVPAISKYHDPMGVTIAAACTLVLWGFALLLKKRRTQAEKQNFELSNREEKTSADLGSKLQVPRLKTGSSFQTSAFSVMSLSLLLWLLAVEGGVSLWYHHIESHLNAGPEWEVSFPTDNPTYKNLLIDEKTQYLLRFDDGKECAWTDGDGVHWEVFYCNWRPGRVAGYLAKRHTPEICLTAIGCRMVSGPDLNLMSVNGVELPIRSYVFEAGGQTLHVYHCRWETGASANAYVQNESERFNLIRSIWNGRGDHGQKVLEIIIAGLDDPAQLKAALTRELTNLIRVQS